VPIFPPNLWQAQRTARGRPIPPPVPRRFYGPGYGCLTNGTRCCTTATAGCITCPADFRQPSSLWGCGVGGSKDTGKDTVKQTHKSQPLHLQTSWDLYSEATRHMAAATYRG
jgi:hypothetical protein